MKFFGYEIRKASKQEISTIPAGSTTRSVFLESRHTPMLLSAVYRCVDVISDAVAQLPLETYQIDAEGFKRPYVEHPVYHLMNEEPNEDMTRFTFFKTLVTATILKGNGYAYIERDHKGIPLQIVYLPDSYVGIEWIIDKNGIRRKRYRVANFKELVEPKDMIHILNFSYDGIVGVSTLTHARQTLGIATDSEAHAAGFFKSGAATSGILSFPRRLSKEQKEEIYQEWENRTHPVTGRPNGIVVLELEQSYHPITISPKDSQLLESRVFNVVDICRFFSVSPVKAFDLSKSSYSTVEATQLAFLTDTVAPIITKIELEFQRKLFFPFEQNSIKIEFNTNAFLRADKAAQAAYFKEMFNSASMTPNEIRKENNLPRHEHGDQPFIHSAMVPLSRAVNPPEETDANPWEGKV
jgi:HK97 family phage portal protein